MMLIGRWLSALLIVGSICPASARAEGEPLAALGWLAGCWEAGGTRKGSGEMWMAPAGGTMFGVSRTLEGGRVVAHELMQIRVGAEGKIVFVATPSGQKEATFTVKSLEGDAVVFEDLGHDFPQRIIYRLERKDRLVARIEGARDDTIVAIDYRMRRIRCEAGTKTK